MTDCPHDHGYYERASDREAACVTCNALFIDIHNIKPVVRRLVPRMYEPIPLWIVVLAIMVGICAIFFGGQ